MLGACWIRPRPMAEPEASAESRRPPTPAPRSSPRHGARLLADGYANLSTRRVADAAEVPLSQIHYHFGSKRQLILAVLEAENERLLERQREMFDAPKPLWVRWERACDFLDTDLESGYVRILQEMIAAGWSDPEVAAAVREHDRCLAQAAGRRRATRAGTGRRPRRVHGRRDRGPDGHAVPGRRGADPARRDRSRPCRCARRFARSVRSSGASPSQ